ncbi:MAG: hypothetical protein ACHQJ6_03590 [Candidatus Berkiellales bacterium]
MSLLAKLLASKDIFQLEKQLEGNLTSYSLKDLKTPFPDGCFSGYTPLMLLQDMCESDYIADMINQFKAKLKLSDLCYSEPQGKAFLLIKLFGDLCNGYSKSFSSFWTQYHSQYSDQELRSIFLTKNIAFRVHHGIHKNFTTLKQKLPCLDFLFLEPIIPASDFEKIWDRLQRLLNFDEFKDLLTYLVCALLEEKDKTASEAKLRVVRETPKFKELINQHLNETKINLKVNGKTKTLTLQEALSIEASHGFEGTFLPQYGLQIRITRSATRPDTAERAKKKSSLLSTSFT